MKVIKSHRKFYIAAGVILLLNAILINFPLLNIIGYEFSAVNSILLYFVGASITLGKKFPFDSKGILQIVTLGLLPLIPGLFGNWLLSICPFSDSIYFYLVLTIPSYIIGLSAGLISKILVGRFRVLLFILLTVMMILSILEELYFNPQVYFYNPILGYYPGVIYDELIQVDVKLVVYRMLNLVFFTGLSFTLVIAKDKWRKIIISASALILCFGFALVKPVAGFSTNINSFTTSGFTYTDTEHFRIFHSDSLTALQVGNLKLEHEFYFNELKRDLGFEPDRIVLSFIFENSRDKKKLVGAGNAEVAKPWLGQIYIERDAIDASLKHELVHVFSAAVGEGILKLPEGFNPAMIEGYAMAFENDFRGEPLYDMTALAFQRGLKPDIPALFSGLDFFGGYSGLSYLYSGAFLKYIAENYSVEAVNRIYSDSDFETHTGKSVDSLSMEFYKFISGIKINFNEHTANLHYGYKPLVKKICPRYLASEQAKADELVKTGKVEDALKKYSVLLDYSDSYSVLRNYVNVLLKNEQAITADSLLSSHLDKYYGTGYYYNLEFLKVKALWRLGDKEGASRYIDSLLIQNPAYGYFSAAEQYRILLDELPDSTDYFGMNDSSKAAFFLSLIEKRLYFGFVFDYLSLTSSGREKTEDIKFLLDVVKMYNETITPDELWNVAEYLYTKYDYDNCKNILVLLLDSEPARSLRWRAGNLLKKMNSFILMSELDSDV